MCLSLVLFSSINVFSQCNPPSSAPVDFTEVAPYTDAHTILFNFPGLGGFSPTSIDANLPFTSGDYIGVFFDDGSGQYQATQVEQWDGSSEMDIFAMGDDPATASKDGFATGDDFVFFMYDCQTNTTIPLTVTYQPATAPVVISTGNFEVDGYSMIASIARAETIVITEFNVCNKWVELLNVGDLPVDISGYYLCKFPNYTAVSGLTPSAGSTDLILESGEYVVLPMATLSSPSGEIGVYYRNGPYGNSNHIADYVQYNAGNNQRASVAVSAGVWDNASGFITAPTVAGCNSMSVIGTPTSAQNTNAGSWCETIPTMGTGFTACAVLGCTDNTACNFNASANSDDGSCTYGTLWYQDADSDGLGNPSVSQTSCTQPTGFVANNNDTDDSCNGTLDACGVCNGPGPATWYQDNDGDGLGNPNVSQMSCTQPTGFVANNTDPCDGTLDCAGVCNGTAFTDGCGDCVGGTTGMTACALCSDVISLNPGWNLISLDFAPTDSSVQSVFSTIQAGNLEFVTGFDNGALVYDPNLPPFLNTLSNVESGFGYWVRVGVADQLTGSGQCIDPTFRKDYDAGWNLTAYPPQTSVAPATYFADQINASNLEFVTGFDNGAETFDPALPNFLNTLTSMDNGFGYWVRVTNAVANKDEGGSNPTNVFSFINGTSNLNEGEVVSVQTVDGAEITKLAVVQDGYLMTTPIYGDDLRTEAIEGIATGEPLVFVWNNQRIDLGVQFNGDLAVEHIHLDFEKVTFGAGITVYPNPASSAVVFEYNFVEAGAIELRLYDVKGQLMEKRQLNPESQRFSYRVDGLKNGIYTYQVISNKESYQGKLEVIK